MRRYSFFNPFAVFTKEEKEKIRSALVQSERTTNAEIALLVVGHSVHGLLFLIPGLLSLLTFAAGFYFLWWHRWGDPEIYYLAGLFAVTIILYAAVFRWTVARTARKKAVRRRAVDEFHSMGLCGTTHHVGLLAYISILERAVEIVADPHIAQKVGDATWRDHADKLARAFKDKDVDRLCETLKEIGTVLSTHFPKTPDDKDEFPTDITIKR